MVVAAVLIAVAVVLTLVITGNEHHSGPPKPDALGQAAPGTWPGDTGTGTDFRAGDADLVVLDGVSGKIQVSADPDAHTVSGTFDATDPGHGQLARIGAVADRADGPHALTIACADANDVAMPCAGNLAITVPEHTGLRLRQTSGETELSGIGGELTVSVASDRFTAQDLRAARAAVTVVSGSADLGFAAAPDSLAVHTTSASTTLRLPAGDGSGYAVTTAATSADVQVQVPRRDDAPHKLSLQVLSGSLAVLPA